MTIQPTSKCVSCGEPIFWALTETGAKMPMDPAPPAHGYYVTAMDDGQLPRIVFRAVQLGEPRYTSHFATCRDKKKWEGL